MMRITIMIYTHVILICELFLKGSINYFDQQTRISSSFRIFILSKSCYCYCYSIVFCKVFILHLSFYILACKLVKIKITYDKVFLNILKEQNFYKTIDMKWFRFLYLIRLKLWIVNEQWASARRWWVLV